MKAKVQLDRRDVRKLASSLNTTRRDRIVTVSETDRLTDGIVDPGHPSWWNPNSVRKFRAFRAYRVFDEPDILLLVDTRDSKHALAYLYYFDG